MARYRQAGAFRVRQQEQLRRALRSAGEALGWGLLVAEQASGADEVAADIQRLTRAGLRQLERDLEEQMAAKRGEVRQLDQTVKELSKLAEEGGDAFPAQIEYRYTSRQGKDDLVTRSEAVVVEDPDQAEKAAARLARRRERLHGMQREMLARLKKRQAVLAEVRSELRTFLSRADRMIDAVLAVLA